MEILYRHNRKFYYAITKYKNKSVLDAWLITGTKYKAIDYFGEYTNLKDLKSAIDLCREKGLF